MFLVLAEGIGSRKYECLIYDLIILFWEDVNSEFFIMWRF